MFGSIYITENLCKQIFNSEFIWQQIYSACYKNCYSGRVHKAYDTALHIEKLKSLQLYNDFFDATKDSACLRSIWCCEKFSFGNLFPQSPIIKLLNTIWILNSAFYPEQKHGKRSEEWNMRNVCSEAEVRNKYLSRGVRLWCQLLFLRRRWKVGNRTQLFISLSQIKPTLSHFLDFSW